MKHSHTSRNYAKALFTFVTIGLAGACADSNMAPPATEAAAFTAPASFSEQIGVTVFRVNNAYGLTARVGAHVINIPAGAICDPLVSSYGPTEWDKPCEPLRGSIVITATILQDAEAHPYVDFQPALRFVPTKEVMLFLRNGRSSHATQLNIEYCNNIGVCADESLADPSLKPFRVGRTSVIGRRVKHFSGYMVTTGADCQGSLTEEPNGTWMCNDEGGSGGMTRRSGYMVASGMDGDDADPSDDGKGAKKSDSQ